MEGSVKRFFISNWQRKFLSIMAAIVIWFLINSSITTTRTFPQIPVRVVNLPSDKTISGLLPNGILERRMRVTLTGRKSVIDSIGSNDFEVIIDAAGKGDHWVVDISKRNLVCLSPDIDLMHNVSKISHSDYVITLSKLATGKIPIYMTAPTGEPPLGYQFIDVWPKKLMQVVSGPEEDIQQLQKHGLELTFNLGAITQKELDSLKSANDEVHFFVPESWKKISIPFLQNAKQELNSQDVKNLRIDFLKKSVLPLGRKLPVRVFYPMDAIDSFNSERAPLLENELIKKENGSFFFAKDVYVKNVSTIFLDIVRDRIELEFVRTKQDKDFIWCVQFIDPEDLEDRYVKRMMTEEKNQSDVPQDEIVKTEERIRHRFRKYSNNFALYLTEELPLNLEAHVKEKGVEVVLEKP